MVSQGPVPILDDPSSVDAARKRVSKTPGRFAFLRKTKSHPSWSVSDTDIPLDLDALPPTHLEAQSTSAPDLDDPIIDLCEHPSPSKSQDVYRWAVVFENQRGLVLFSIPYFSSLSLLPSDPLPFTLPTASIKRSKQPNISLDSYPMPSGQWKWVSKQWMIDMRSEAGQVQHDGYEYNWVFRRHHWRAEVGKLSAGGLVRRRKWIRLMVLPACSSQGHPITGQGLRPTAELDGTPSIQRLSPSRFTPDASSTRTSGSGLGSLVEVDPDQIWLGGDVAQSWWMYRSYSVLQLQSDGHRLAAWCNWLGLPSGRILRHRPIQWSEDESSRLSWSPASSPVLNTTPLGNVLAVISSHYREILQSFIYPQSRADFLKLLVISGAVEKLDIEAAEAIRSLDFWSYAEEVKQAQNNGSTP